MNSTVRYFQKDAKGIYHRLREAWSHIHAVVNGRRRFPWSVVSVCFISLDACWTTAWCSFWHHFQQMSPQQSTEYYPEIKERWIDEEVSADFWAEHINVRCQTIREIWRSWWADLHNVLAFPHRNDAFNTWHGWDVCNPSWLLVLPKDDASLTWVHANS